MARQNTAARYVIAMGSECKRESKGGVASTSVSASRAYYPAMQDRQRKRNSVLGLEVVLVVRHRSGVLVELNFRRICRFG